MDIVCLNVWVLQYNSSRAPYVYAEIGEGALSCLRHCHSSRLLVTDGARLGARSARGGIFHMPTILQTTATPEKEVVLDIPYGEVGEEVLCCIVVTSMATILLPTGFRPPRKSEGDHRARQVALGQGQWQGAAVSFSGGGFQ